MGEMTIPPESWEAIEELYRAGQVSIREIARQYGISDTAIRKRAKDEGWQRDLTNKVRVQVRSDLVRDAVRTPNACEPEIINAAAAQGVEVVRSHRRDLSRLRRIADTLADRLELFLDATSRQEEAEAVETLQRLGHFMGDRESPGDLLDKLSKALGRVIPLERQAFNLDDPAEFNPAALVSSEQARRMAQEVLNDGGGAS